LVKMGLLTGISVVILRIRSKIVNGGLLP
jgi:hypothetical protein